MKDREIDNVKTLRDAAHISISDSNTLRPADGGVLGRIDKYEIVRELGEGGFGAVYLAHDTVANTDVAIKGLPPEVKQNNGELENIRRNFALVKRLRHPNIVAVTDLHLAQSVSYESPEVEDKLRVFARDTMVVMDYAPGVTLTRWRKQFQGGKVPIDQALSIVRQIAPALDYAHGQKVFHRDVKSDNVMVETSEDGHVTARVLDFGLAAEIRSSMGHVSCEIRDRTGTRRYMAPEQWHGMPQGPANGGSRVLRGGGWNDLAQDCRSASRQGSFPGICSNNFRKTYERRRHNDAHRTIHRTCRGCVGSRFARALG